jgi:hypothetical protein
MKSLLAFFTLIGVLLASPTHVFAKLDHMHHTVGGPKGGRLLEHTQPVAEFYVEKDRMITITFYDEALKPVAAAEQTVTVIAKTESSKSTIEFEKKGDVLVSKQALPEDHAVNLVVQFKQTADAKPVNFRFAYEDHVCGGCKLAEYACICGH